MKKVKLISTLLIVLIITAVPLSGCGSSGSGSEPGTASATSTDLSSEAASSPPKEISFYEVKDTVTINYDNIKTFGRSREASEGGIEFLYSSSGFTFQFRGTSVSAEFTAAVPEEIDENSAPYMKVFVDGAVTADFKVSGKNTYVLAENLKDETHTVKVVKRTECFSPVVAVKLIFPQGAYISEKLPDAARKIEYIGDSITCGYGNIAPESETEFKTIYEDSTQAFGWLVSDYFGADCAMVAQSGNGVSRNYSGETENLIPDLYQLTAGKATPEWDFSKWQADVVCINLGTNDGASGQGTSDDFIAKSVSFLQQVRKAHPNAVIIWSYGVMINEYGAYVPEIVEEYRMETGDTRVSSFEAGAIDEKTEGFGTHGHPSAKTHQRLAKELQGKIAELTGWK